MKNDYKIKRLTNGEYKEWILKKHYAKRKCSVSYCFGLILQNKIIGICTFGYPPNYNYNKGKCLYKDYECLTLELNRLVINNYDEKNLLSYFLANSIKLLPKPITLVSYADPNQNHQGYIYQATNWIYTGESTPKKRYTFEDGSTFDIRRGIHNKGKIVKTEQLKPTHRYIYLHANKKDKKIMLKQLKVNNLDYPKGLNKKYECIDIDMDYELNLFDT